MTKNTYWFKRRRYGYGWTPVTWQGWVTVGLLLVVVLGGAYLFATGSKTTQSFFLFLNTVVMAVILSVIVAISKGPSAKWRWGKKEHDNKDEDF